VRRATLAVVALACICLPASARADGDPASDYLLVRDAFYPFQVAIDPDARRGLDATLRAAAAHGFKIRVALIAHDYDLGAVPQLYNKPQQYAEFLGQELAFVYPGRLLVAMPTGYGYARRGKPDPGLAAALSTLPPPGQDGTALTSGATAAVGRLAEEAGHPLPESVVPDTGSGSSDRTLLFVGAAAVIGALALAGVAGLLIVRGRRRSVTP
jgi:hypothetical protein